MESGFVESKNHCLLFVWYKLGCFPHNSTMIHLPIFMFFLTCREIASSNMRQLAEVDGMQLPCRLKTFPPPLLLCLSAVYLSSFWFWCFPQTSPAHRSLNLLVSLELLAHALAFHLTLHSTNLLLPLLEDQTWGAYVIYVIVPAKPVLWIYIVCAMWILNRTSRCIIYTAFMDVGVTKAQYVSSIHVVCIHSI